MPTAVEAVEEAVAMLLLVGNKVRELEQLNQQLAADNVQLREQLAQCWAQLEKGWAAGK